MIFTVGFLIQIRCEENLQTDGDFILWSYLSIILLFYRIKVESKHKEQRECKQTFHKRNLGWSPESL